MDLVRQIEAQREAVLEEMRSMRSLKRGTINEQYLPVVHQGKREPVLRGPYYVFSRREKDRTVSHRLRTAQELEEARENVAAYQRFKALCEQLEQLTERLGELQRQREDGERKKKDFRLPSNRTGKSGGF